MAIFLGEIILCLVVVGSRHNLESAYLFGDWIKRNHALDAHEPSFKFRVLVHVQPLDSRFPVLVVPLICLWALI